MSGAPLPIQFPDDSSYAKYLASGGADMPRADWRRENVNTFVRRLYGEVHRLKPSVKMGISPFGIWRPGNPAGITGLDAFASLFADSKKWLENGWVDYLAPQLYWPLSSTGQNFTALLDWWIGANTQRRHLWPGLAAYRVADGTSSQYGAAEIVAELGVVRARAGAAAGGAFGALLYNTTAVRLNRGGLADALATASYAGASIVPATPWLDGTPPMAPTLIVGTQGSALRAQWTPGDPEGARWWLVQWRAGGAWRSRLLWGAERLLDIPFTGAADRADVVAVSALDGAMNISSVATWRATGQ